MYCSKCGKELIINAKFCDSCGTQVDQSMVNKTLVSTINDNYNKTFKGDSSNSGEEASAKTLKKKKTIGKVIMALVGVMVFLAISRILFLEIIGFIFIDDEPIEISNISYETGWIDNIDLSMDITNVSNKDVSYIYIDTYAYDRMASELSMETLKYTGPFEAGESYTISWEDLFYESGVYAVWPKDVKVVYMNGGETTFENSLYCYMDGFYSKGLK